MNPLRRLAAWLDRKSERSAVVEEVEPRILYSADLNPALWAGGATQASAIVAAVNPDAPATQPPVAAQQQSRHEIAFVDSAVPDAQKLIDGLRASRPAGTQLEVVALQAGVDGVAQISAVLADERGLDAIHIISHGSDGTLEIGSTRLDAARLAVDAGSVARWGQALGADGDLLLYGCDVAKDATGQAFIQNLARLTGADVAASTDLTGQSLRGGNWDLEYRAGQIETSVAASQQTQDEWQGLLAVSVEATSSGFAAGTNSVTISHTTTATGNRLMLVGVAMDANGGPAVSTVTYGGQSMSFVGFRVGGSAPVRIEIWKLVNPNAGTANVVVNLSGNADGVSVGATTFSGVDQTTPLGTFASAIGTSNAPSVNVSSAVGELVYDVVAGKDAGTLAPGAGQSELWDVSASGQARGASSTEAGAATVTMSWVKGSALEWAVGGVSIKAAAASAAPTVANLTGDTLAYSVGSGAVVIEQGANATVTDIDSPNFDTGALTVSLAAGGVSSQDVLGIRNQGTGAGQIGVSGANVTYGGTTIGTLAGGSGGTNLVITLNANADSTNTAALIQNITYQNTETSVPSMSARTVRFVLTDGDGGTSGNYDTIVNVSSSTLAVVTTATDAADGDTSSIAALNANKGADGFISLREAIIAANNTAGADAIRFNIAGTGVHTINVASALPAITGAVTLDATTDDSFAANGNKPAIILDGNNSFTGDGLVLTTTADGSTIRGLVIRDFSGDGIEIQAGSDGNTIAGNYIGRLGTAGTIAAAGEENTSSGIRVLGANNTIGGTGALDRNVIGGNVEGIYLTGPSANTNTVLNNYIGVDLTGASLIANSGRGIYIDGGASGNVIGQAGYGNVISGSGNIGVHLVGGTGNVFKGNTIGLNAAGTAAISNGAFGLAIDGGASGTIVGGTGAGEGNLISGNTGSTGSVAGGGIYIQASNSTIQGNIIGLDYLGTTLIANGRAVTNNAGIYLFNGSSNNLIGGTAANAGNTIAGNTGDGIMSAFSGASVFTALGNRIYSNTEEGIDLTEGSVAVNDAGDADTGVNNQQNFPVLTSANSNTSGTTIIGTINSNANTTLRIEFFGNRPTVADAPNGEGERYLGFITVTTDGSGNASVNTTLANVWVNSGDKITATATVDLGSGNYGSTSEFAANVTAASTGIIVVDTTSDVVDGTTTSITNLGNARGADGRISLREAISAANNTANGGTPDKIVFAIPVTDTNHVYYRDNAAAGTFSAAVATTRTDSAINDFDADYATGTARSWYRITLGTLSLDVTQAVIIDGSTQAGYDATKGPIIEINAAAVTGGDANAIALTTGASTIRGLVINRAGDNAIEIDVGATSSVIVGNYIGTDVSGTQALGNSTVGTWGAIAVKTNSVVIGGTTAADRNLISGNQGYGIEFYSSASGAVVQGNYIGTTLTGIGSLGNTVAGIYIRNSSAGNTIGGTGANEGNVIANNGGDGVWVAADAGTGNRILGNSIYSNAGQGIDLGATGVTANDANDADTGANNLQNFPVLASARTDGAGQLILTGTLNSTASTQFRIEFFANSAQDGTGYGEGQRYLGFANITTDGAGNATISTTLTATVAVGDFISATATKSNAGFTAYTDTSELARNVAAVSSTQAVVTVDTSADTSDGDTSSLSTLLANKGADGFISLREAIIAANNTANGTSGADRIHFDIAGAGPHTITPLSVLPTITGTVVIDGSSEPDFAGSPIIELNGASIAAGGTNGLNLAAGASGSTIRGLVINRFTGNGIDIQSTGNTIVGNWIGLDVTGTVDLGNGSDGIAVKAANNIIGGTTPAERNVTSGNSGQGIDVDPGVNGTIITGNYIGTNATGTAGIGNGSGGIIVENSNATTIGGTAPGQGNVIAFNTGIGVNVTTTPVTGVRILGNSIYSNTGIGIDLGNNGVTANDAAPDSDAGANNLQNFPVLTSASSTAVGTTIVGSLASNANSTYRIEFFGNRPAIADASNGEGERYLGFITVTTNGSGNAAINTTLANVWVNSGDKISATATVDLGSGTYGDTSEFAVNVTATSTGIIVVDTTSDSYDSPVAAGTVTISTLGTGRGADGRISLREAINAVNNTVNGGTPDKIVFAIPAALSGGVHTINVGAAGLPTITQAVIIDGSSEPDFTGTPVIELNGGNLGSGIKGITLGAGSDGSTIRGLIINRFTGTGIEISGSNNHTIQGNWIGLDATGTVAAANGVKGIYGLNSTGNLIGGTTAAQRNVISGNAQQGIYFDNVDSSTISGNYIGTNVSGTGDVTGTSANTLQTGVMLVNGSSGNVIGGTSAAARNVISGNNHYGFEVLGAASQNNLVQGNHIGTTATGLAALGNTNGGASFWGAGTGNTLGGGPAGARNVIAGNYGLGVLVGSASTGATIQGNYIGVGADGLTALGNGSNGISVEGASTNTRIGTDANGTNDAAEQNVIAGNLRGVYVTDAGTTGTVIAGNIIGLAADGNTIVANTNQGISVVSGAGSVMIGGATSVSRNVISGNASFGVYLGSTTSGSSVLSNYIGTNAAGTAARGNLDGVWIDGSANNIIGQVGAGNVISGSTYYGVTVDQAAATGNVIRANLIGVDAAGTANLGNGAQGIQVINGATSTSIGGTTAGQGNTVAFNAGDGIYVAAGTGNSILGNSVYSNVDQGIDLGTTGITANDALDADTGANNLQNFPVLTTARTDGASQPTLTGTLNSTASTQFRIEFFANTAQDGSGYGEGQRYLGFANVTTDGAGNATISTTLTATVAAGEFISATATKSNAGFTVFTDTSEFARNIAAVSSSQAVVTVDTTSDASDGDTTSISTLLANKGADGFISLREAIIAANNTANGTLADKITFNISGVGSQVITPLTALPNLTDAVSIDGTTQAGWIVGNYLPIVLDGNDLNANGLNFASGSAGSAVRGLVVRDFGQSGILANSGGSGIQIAGNFLGAFNSGGTVAAATEANALSGIKTSSGANTIGGTSIADRNYIGGNVDKGIDLQSNANVVQGNVIGVAIDGTTANGNINAGIVIWSSSNLIGGTAAGTGNVFANSTSFRGISVRSGTGNALLGNAIYNNQALGIDLNNDDVTLNDTGDADTGPNNLQNFPVLTTATTTGAQVTFTGTLNSTANTQFRIEFFASAAQDGSGYGEGQRYLGFANVTTDGSGNATINTTLTATVAVGEFISATATKSNAGFTVFTDTSEFAQNVVATVANTAPTLGNGTLAAVNEDTASPGGQAVSAIFSGQFSDPDSGSSFGGIAVVGNTASAGTQGSWQYSSNGGSNWFAIGTVADGATALALSSSTLVRFVPVADYNGTPPALTVRGLDNTYVAGFSTTAGSETRVNVNTTSNGGSTAIAAATASLSTSITAVNDAPVITNLSGDSLSYAEGDGAVVIEQGGNATVTDVDSVDFSTGTLTVSFTAGSDSAEDVLAIRNQGTGAGQIGVSGANVTYGGVTIGSFTGGSAGANLVITFNGLSSPTAAQALIRNITFQDTDTNAPTTGARTVRFVLTDGDGGTSANHDTTVTVSGVNDAPVISSNGGGATAAINVAENLTAVTTVTSTDVDGGTAVYSISGGADAAKFTINSSTGVLTFVAAPNYEAPTDVGANNVYDLIVQVSDGALTDTQAIAVTVTAVNENNPVITSNGGGATAAINLAENATAVTTVTATDADLPAQTLTYSISGGADAAKFTINASTGALSFAAAPDFEAPSDVGANNVYDVIVHGSDGTLSDTQAIAVTVTAANDNTPVITSNGGAATAAVSVAENATAVTTVTATDADLPAQTLTYSISGGADAAKFTINASTGALTFVAAPNYEAPTDVGANNVYDVTVQASDGTLTDSQAIAVTVTAVNDNAPVITSNGGGATAAVNMAENGSAVTTVTATDADLPAQTLTYSISGGADAAKFTINASTGALTFVAAPNYEAPTDVGTDNVYDVIVQVSDGTLSDTQAIAVTVTATNDNTPVITSNGAGATAAVNVAENATAVTTVTAADADLPSQTLTYSISGGADAAKFTINSSTGALSFVSAPNYESPTDAGGNNVYDVTVQVSDGTLTDTQAIAVTVTAVNDNNPVITSDGGGGTASVNVAENAMAVVTVTATDADLPGQTLTYSISGGADAAKFTINASTGALGFVAAPNYESPTDAGANNVYDVIVQVSDGSLTDTQAIAVTVTAVNDNNPVITSNGGGATAAVNVAENATSVTTVTATDADLPSQTLTYSISGGADAAKFAINASTGVLSFVAAPNYESPTDVGANNVYDVVVQVSDGSLTDIQAIAVTVTPVNEAPTITSDGAGATAARNVAENGSAVTTVVATDPDAATTLTYAITGGADAAKFTINASTGVLSFVSAPNYEAPTDAGANNVYDVTVQVSDGTLTDTQAIAVTVTPVNEAPAITSDGAGAAAAVNVAENSSAVTTVTATDPDAATTLTYAITGGADAAKFAINASTGALSFLATPNYESPTDAGANNVYDVTVQVSDGTLTDTQAIAVTVTPVNDNNPVITSNGGGASATVNVAENATAATTVTATDADLPGQTLTYSISGGADAAKFTINASTGALAFATAPDHDAPTDSGANNVYDVVVQVSDGTLTDSQAIAVTVTPVNDNTPVITSDGGGASAGVDVAENSTAVTTVIATDADLPGQTLTYSIVGGADAAQFVIDAGTGALSFVSAPDFETPTDADSDNVYQVVVQVSDGTFTDTQAIAATVTQVNVGAPVITSDGGGPSAAINVAENTTAVTLVTATDPDFPVQPLTYSISGGADAARFSIDANTGTLSFLAAPDREAPSDANADNIYNVVVQGSDGTLIDTQSIAVTVTPVNDNTPVITSDGGGNSASVNVAENATAVTTVTATDADLPGQTLTYSITGGADAAKFAIDSSTGVLTFIAPPNFEVRTDAGADNVYDVTVQVSDGTLTDTQSVAVTVTPVNDNSPTITSDGGGNSAAVNDAENATAVTTVTASDADLPGQTLTYSISGGADAAKFAIDSSTGVLSFVAAPNFEVPTDVGGDNVYNVVVQVSDGALTDTQSIAVTVTALNDNTPVITSDGGGNSAALNVAENSTAVTTVSATDADLPGETLTYSIIGGSDAARFTIDSSTGVLTFVAAPNFEAPTDANADNVYDVTVQVSDGSLTDTQAIAVSVTAVNDNTPVITSDGGGNSAALNVVENATAVTTVTATDADLPGQTLTYSITGGADAARFAIDSSTGVLTFIAAPNFESPIDANADNVYNVVVQVSDGSLSDTQAIAVTVTAVNDNTPVITSDGGSNSATLNVAENGTAVTTVTATDADLPGQTLTYSITGGADAAQFVIDGSTGVLTFVAAPNFESPTDANADNVYDVVVQVSDGTLTDTQSLAVSVTAVNDNTPTITSDGGANSAALNVAENATAVTTVTAGDADLPGQTLTYSIVGGADAAKFAIDSSTGVLSFASAPNYESPIDVGADNVYDVVVQVSDGALTDTQSIAVTVTPVNDNTPVITSDGGGNSAAVSVAENAATVTTVTASDADLPGQTLTYSITGGADAAKFAIDSSTGLLTFVGAPNFEVPTDANADNVYDVVVQVSDGTLGDTQAIAITVTPANDNTPVITSNGGANTAALNVAENSTAVTTVTATDADLPGQTLTYSISGGADAARFAIDSSTGVLTFVAAPNFETPTDANADNVYDVVVQASDGSQTDTQAIAVTVTAVNDNTPVITSDGGGNSAVVSVAENATAVTAVTASDADLPSQTLTYSITGGADAAKFAIDSSTGVLTFVAAPNFETPADANADNVYDVVVQVSDGTLTDTQAIAVTVTAVNDNTPVITSDGGANTASLNVAENSTAVTTVTATDADLPGQTLTYSIAGGVDAARFTIDASTGVLSFVAAPDFEAPIDANADNVYDVVVQVSDGTLTDTQAIAVTVTPVNDNTPIITSDGGANSAAVGVAENATAVTTVTASDADLPGQTLTYSIAGGADAARFTIDASTGALSFIAAPDFELPGDAGADNVYDVVVQVSDGTLSDTQAIAVTLSNVNEAPLNTVPAAQSTNEDSALVFSAANGNLISVSDVDAGNNPVQVTLSASHGSITLAGTAGLSFTTGDGTADATLTFTGTLADINAALDGLAFMPAADFNGAAGLQITTSDLGQSGSGGALTTTDNVAITVNALNDDPVLGLAGGSYTFSENAPPLLIATPAIVGDVDSVNFDGGQMVVSITANGLPEDHLTLRDEGTGVGQVGVSGASVSYGGVLVGSFNGPVSGSATLIVTFNANADAATVQAVVRNLTYQNTSDAPSSAVRTIQAYVTDGDGGVSATASGTVSVTPLNDAPVLDNSAALTLTVTEDAGGPSGAVGALVGAFTAAITDVDNGAVKGIAITASDQSHGTWYYSTDGGSNWAAVGPVNAGSALLLADDAGTRLYFAPAADYSGAANAALTIRAWDQTSGSAGTKVDTAGAGGTTAFSGATDVIDVTVTAVNDAPTTTAVTLAPIAEDSGARLITQAELLANATDIDGPSLTASGLAITSGSGTLVDNGNGTWSYTPASNDDTGVSFSYNVTDGSLNASGSATLDISPVNDAPTSTAVTLAPIGEDSGARLITQAELLANASDIDGPSLTATGLAIASGGGTLTDNGNGTWSYTPALNDDTSVSFSYSVTDGSLSAVGSATLDITPVNDAPSTTPVTLTPITEDSGARLITQAELLANASDVDGPSLTATGLTISSGAGNLVDNGNGTWSYTPVANDETAVSFSYTVTDGSSSAAGSATLDITPVNDAPTTTPVTLTPIAEDSGARLITQAELLANAADSDGPSLTATGLMIASGSGTLADNGNGTWTYSPAANDDTSVSFSYNVTDGTASVAGTASLDITPVNDAPTTTAVTLVPIAEDSGARLITQAELLANATDVDGPSLTATSLAIASGSGALVDNGNGTWSYTPAANDDTAVSFSYTVTDGTLSAAGIATLDITSVNDAPNALAPGVSMLNENALAGTLVATVSASDPDAGELFSFSLLSDAAGRFTIDASSGAVRVAPGALLDFQAQPSFDLVVRVTDAGGLSYSQTLRVDLLDVPGPAPAPTPAAAPAAAPARAAAPAPSEPPPASASLATVVAAASATAPVESSAAGTPSEAAESADSAGRAGDAGDLARRLQALIDPRASERDGAPGESQRLHLRVREGVEGPLISVAFDAQAGDVPVVISAWDEAAAKGSISTALRNAVLARRDAPIEAETSVRQEGSEANRPNTLVEILQDPVRMASATFTAGFVWWLTRSGGLLTTMLMGVPAWRHVDLLPVLANHAEDEDERDARQRAGRRGGEGGEGDDAGDADHSRPADDFEDSAVAELFTPGAGRPGAA